MIRPTRSSASRRAGAGVGLVLAGLFLMTGTAGAHLTPTEPEGPAGGEFSTAFQIGHGCGDKPTTKVEIKIPEGVTGVVPKEMEGWTISTTTRPVDPPLEIDGKEVSETVDTVTFEGGPLPSGETAQFGMSMRLPEGSPGDRLYFPFVQSCGSTTQEWLGITKEGEPEPEFPAGMITLGAATADHSEHGGTASSTTAVDSSDHDAGTVTGTTDQDMGTTNAVSIAALVIALIGLALAVAAFVKVSKLSADGARAHRATDSGKPES
ncbi:MAG: YcnI family protein [Microthrixaceae bacterium]